MTSHIPTPGKGVIFQNSKKTTERHPDWKGQLLITKDYKVGDTVKFTGWTKQSAVGQLIAIAEDTFIPDPQWREKLEAKKKEEHAASYPREVKSFNDDEDVPF